MFVPLLDGALENCVRVDPASESGHKDSSTKRSAYGDGAYASRDNLMACGKRDMVPFIKLKASSVPKGKGAGDARGMEVRDQFGGSDLNWAKWLPDEKTNQEEWKTRIRYDKGWMVEIVFSAFKRMFGEHLYSLKWK